MFDLLLFSSNNVKHPKIEPPCKQLKIEKFHNSKFIGLILTTEPINENEIL